MLLGVNRCNSSLTDMKCTVISPSDAVGVVPLMAPVAPLTSSPRMRGEKAERRARNQAERTATMLMFHPG